MIAHRNEWLGLTAVVLLLMAWLCSMGWSAYDAYLIRSSESSDTWAVGAIFLVSILTLLMIAVMRLYGNQWKRYGASFLPWSLGALLLGLVTVGITVWAVEAPLPETRAVALPSSHASPSEVVQAYVAALNEHDAATAATLCVHGDPPCQDVNAFVDLRVVRIVRVFRAESDSFVPNGMTGEVVELTLRGQRRNGAPVGEDGLWSYTLTRTGPDRAWRVVDEGMG